MITASQTSLNFYWLWHPLLGPGYQFWSGIASDIGEITLLGAIGMWWTTHNCHVHKCWRLSWHTHPISMHPVCKKHHPEHPSNGGTKIESD